MNGTHQILFYADDVNILDNINTITETQEALLQAGRETGLEVNTKKTSRFLCPSTIMQDKITVY